MRFSASDIVAQFDPAYVAGGKQYWQQHRVEGFAIADGNDGTVITATVQGTEAKPYHVHITPHPKGESIIFRNRCSCGVEAHCKHVVAVLFEACNQFQREDLRKAPLKGLSHQPALPEDVSRWLEAFEAERPSLSGRRVPTKQLIYLLIQDRRGRARLTLATVRLDREGMVLAEGMEPYYAVDAALRVQPKFMTPEDMDLIRALHPYRLGQGPAEYEFKGDSADLLRRLLRTQRLYWKDTAAPLHAGEPRSARIEWQNFDDGTQQLTFVAEPPCTAVLPTVPPWYVDAERAAVGELTTPLDARSAALIADAPRVTTQALDVVAERLNRVASADVIPPPRSRRMRVQKDIAPHPVIFLFGRERKSQYFNAPRTPLAALRLRFDYQGTRINPTDPEIFVVRSRDQEVIQIERQLKAEREIIKTLQKLIPVIHAQDALQSWEREGIEPDDYVMSGANTEVEWSHFVLTHAPELQVQGWKIEYELSFPHRFAEVENWFGGVEPDVRNEWFDLELGIQVEGQKVNLLPLLVQALRAGAEELSVERLRNASPDKTLTLRLPDGRCVSLPYGRVAHLLGTLIELYEGHPLDAEGKLRLSRLDALRLAELQKANDAVALRWFGDESLIALGEKLRDFSGVTAVPVPAGLNATLRDYQLQGLSWLQFLREYGFGGILADDMGLGKTVQTLAHILVEKEQGRLKHPALVVAPTSLVGNWAREAQQFAPGLRVLCLHGQARRQQFSEIQDHDLIVTTYPLLPRDKATLLKQKFHLLVLDEAQNIKNAKSLAAQMVQQLRATHRVCLTGTPMENHLGELWSQFHFLQPGLLGDAVQFKRLYRNPIEKNADDARRAHLIQRVSPFILRRTKQQVVKELPPKTEIVRTVALDGAQRDLYETVRLALHEKIRDEIHQRGMDRSHIVILDALLKLRQICCDPRLLKMEAARKADGSSAKLELLMDLLPEMIEEGRRVLLFSQFTSMLELIEQELNGRNIRYLKLTGETQHRQHLVDAFQRGDAPLFLISLKAGGVGLNLTAADTVIHYDPWWNPAVENQATDRAYRIGQDKPVFVYKLVAESSIEEKIQALQARKAALAASILSGGEGASGPQFNAEDLKSLFEPLG